MSARRVLPRDELIKLAKITLGKAYEKGEIPSGYLDELRKHVKFSKDDTLFRVYPHMGIGYGNVLCLEKGCEGVIIELNKRTGTSDDGSLEGIGCLSAYRAHTFKHPTHKQNRNARIKAESERKLNSQANVKTPPKEVPEISANTGDVSAGRIPPGSSPAFGHLSSSDSSINSSSPASSVLGKRNSGPADEDTEFTIPSSSPLRDRGTSVKRMKLTDIKTQASSGPLRPKNPNIQPQEGALSENESSSALPNILLRLQIIDLEEKKSAETIRLDDISAKKRKTSSDLSQIRRLKEKLTDISAQILRCENALSNLSKGQPATGTPLPAVGMKKDAHVNDAKPFMEATSASQSTASGSNLYARTPYVALPSKRRAGNTSTTAMKIDVDDTKQFLGSSTASQSTAPGSNVRTRIVAHPSKSRTPGKVLAVPPGSRSDMVLPKAAMKMDVDDTKQFLGSSTVSQSTASGSHMHTRTPHVGISPKARANIFDMSSGSRTDTKLSKAEMKMDVDDTKQFLGSSTASQSTASGSHVHTRTPHVGLLPKAGAKLLDVSSGSRSDTVLSKAEMKMDVDEIKPSLGSSTGSQSTASGSNVRTCTPHVDFPSKPCTKNLVVPPGPRSDTVLPKVAMKMDLDEIKPSLGSSTASKSTASGSNVNARTMHVAFPSNPRAGDISVSGVISGKLSARRPGAPIPIPVAKKDVHEDDIKPLRGTTASQSPASGSNEYTRTPHVALANPRAGDISALGVLSGKIPARRLEASLPIPVMKKELHENDIKPVGGTTGSRSDIYPPGPRVAPPSYTSHGDLAAPGRIHDVLPGHGSGKLPNIHFPNYSGTTKCEINEDVMGPYFDNVPNGLPFANSSDIEKFLVEAGNMEQFDGNESVDKALKKIGLKKLGEQLPLMTVSLMPHQVIGVAWMEEHERGKHHGGILADEMGLGKTVQMIAMMVLKRSDDPAVKTTLICAPLALLDQWRLEIESKTDGALKCLIYHGPNKPTKVKELQKYDVVITTYHTLALEYYDPEAAEKKKKKQAKKNGLDDFIEGDSEPEKKVVKGLLLNVPWYRVVLDEAQSIRNRNTRISVAVTRLEATYRWCLTGTPVTNSLADCYALIRFLRIRPWYEWQDFSHRIVRLEKKSPDVACRRLQVILNSCLIRRKKDSLLDGKKLVELPPKEIVLQTLEFSQEERDIYNAIEAKSQAVFNRYLRAGTVLKNYAHVLVLLLRLRQLCSHPCLIQEDGNAFVRPEETPTVKIEMQRELERATTLAGKDFVERMRTQFRKELHQLMVAEKELGGAAERGEECPICLDNMTNPLVSTCGHVFCEDCIDAVFNKALVEDGDERHYTTSERPCPNCRHPIQREMLFQRSAFEPTDAEVDDGSNCSPIIVDDLEDGQPIGSDVLPVHKQGEGSGSVSNPVRGKGKHSKKRVSRRIVDSDDDYDDQEEQSDYIQSDNDDSEDEETSLKFRRRLRKDKQVIVDSDDEVHEELFPSVVAKKRKVNLERFLPSTKMKEMMVLLKKCAEAEETKNEKTIVLSQWTSCLDLVAKYMDENDFTYVRYQGNMSRHTRDEAVRTFMAQGTARILLMSLKCGGVGLNLTRANRVISLDLGWSTAVEYQAFDRVHRLGQTLPVTVHKLVIENTVETRILALQDRKKNLADGSLGEGSGRKIGRLSVRDLANLFGLDGRGI